MNKQSKDGIIRLKKEGLSNAEIAKNLNLKLATVIHYITLIRKSDDCPEWFRQSLNEHRKRIDDAIEDIMKELAAGSSLEAVSEKYGASKKTIEERIKLYESKLIQDECENEELRWIVEKAMIATVDQGKVLALARAGWKLKDIADELDVTEQVIKKVLEKCEIQSRVICDAEQQIAYYGLSIRELRDIVAGLKQESEENKK